MFKKEYLEKVKEAKKTWTEKIEKKSLERFGIEESPNKFFTPLDIEDFDFLKDGGFPGAYPYVAGRYPVSAIRTFYGKGSTAGVGAKLKKSAGRYSGYGTPEDTRDFYNDMREKGFQVGGPNLACDLPTQTGRDSDDEFAEGEVGTVGVAVDSLRDFEIIYEPFVGDMGIDKIATNWTINGACNYFIAMYAALAQQRGIPLDKLRGTPQNDILKEYVARGTQIFPPKASMRMTRDSITYCTENMPNFNIMSISGYHIREFGASRVQTVAFTFANAIAYFELGMNAGLDIDKFAHRMTWLSFGGGMEVLKEVAVRRAARRVWSHIMKDRLGSKKPSNAIIRELGTMLIGYWTATKQRPLNNLTRSVLGGAFSALIGDNPFCSPPYDEPLGLGHSLEAQQLEEDAARIVIEEAKLCEVFDPFAGSYYIESLTSRYEKEIVELIDQIDKMGGAVATIETGWMKEEMMRSSDAFRRGMEDGSIVQVGVNKYTGDDEMVVTTARTVSYDAERRATVEERKLESLAELKKNRDNEKVQAWLKRIKEAAEDESVNLIPIFIDAVKDYVTIGEVHETLTEVFGEAM